MPKIRSRVRIYQGIKNLFIENTVPGGSYMKLGDDKLEEALERCAGGSREEAGLSNLMKFFIPLTNSYRGSILFAIFRD